MRWILPVLLAGCATVADPPLTQDLTEPPEASADVGPSPDGLADVVQDSWTAAPDGLADVFTAPDAALDATGSGCVFVQELASACTDAGPRGFVYECRTFPGGPFLADVIASYPGAFTGCEVTEQTSTLERLCC